MYLFLGITCGALDRLGEEIEFLKKASAGPGGITFTGDLR
jgi:hypothetical protein